MKYKINKIVQKYNDDMPFTYHPDLKNITLLYYEVNFIILGQSMLHVDLKLSPPLQIPLLSLNQHR